MKQEDLLHIKNQLQNISAGQLTIAHHTLSAQDSTLFLNQFLAKTKGKGKVEAYVLFPGIEASYNIFFVLLKSHSGIKRLLPFWSCSIAIPAELDGT